MMQCRLVVMVMVIVVVVVVVVQTHLAHFLVRDYHEDVAVDQLGTGQ